MKEFTKYTFYLTLSLFSASAIILFIMGIVFLVSGIITSNPIAQDKYLLLTCIYGLLSIAFWVFGFIFSSIIHLLRQIAYKDEK